MLNSANPREKVKISIENIHKLFFKKSNPPSKFVKKTDKGS